MNVKAASEHQPFEDNGTAMRNGEQAIGSDARKGGGKPQRAQAMLGRGRSVVVIGRGLDIDLFLQILQEAITKGRRAKSYGLSLDAFLRMSRDSAQ